MRDVIIVGSGPAGYSAAVYAARASMRPLVLEGSVSSGGALMTTTEVENFPGFPDGVQGPMLMDAMRLQAEKFGAELLPLDAVSLDLTGAVKAVATDEALYSARSVILAMGSAYKKLGLEKEEKFTGRGVSWCATCDGFFFRDKNIAVVGGGDSAAEEALFLTRFANNVKLLVRSDRMSASKVMQDRVFSNSKIEVLWQSEIAQLQGDGKLEAVTLTNDTVVPLDGLFVAIGHLPRSELVKDQVHLDAEGYVLVQHPTTHTNVDGVFAAGDLVDNRYRQAITAAGSGAAAALDAEKFLASFV